jgi:DNA-binding NarL/FixJ family response regulator
VAVLRRAVDGLAALGARADAARAAALLRRHGIGAGRPSFGDRLSPRELEVARLVAEGLTNPEIAERLFLSPATVAQHVNAARRKLRAATRTALAVRVVEEGLVPGGR